MIKSIIIKLIMVIIATFGMILSGLSMMSELTMGMFALGITCMLVYITLIWNIVSIEPNTRKEK